MQLSADTPQNICNQGNYYRYVVRTTTICFCKDNIMASTVSSHVHFCIVTAHSLGNLFLLFCCVHNVVHKFIMLEVMFLVAILQIFMVSHNTFTVP